MNKVCKKCGEYKESSEFSKGKNKKDGLYSYCKECEKINNIKYYKNNREKEINRVKIYQENNKEKIKALRMAKKDELNEYQNEYAKRRRKVDPLYKLAFSIRKNTSDLFKGKKSKKTVDLLGCSFEHFKIHLERQFQPGMTWDNHGKWHIDHKYPLSLAKNVQELEKLCHFSNLQPLWAIDNLKKGNKIVAATQS